MAARECDTLIRSVKHSFTSESRLLMLDQRSGFFVFLSCWNKTIERIGVFVQSNGCFFVIQTAFFTAFFLLVLCRKDKSPDEVTHRSNNNEYNNNFLHQLKIW